MARTSPVALRAKGSTPRFIRPVSPVSVVSWYVIALALSAALVPVCRAAATRKGFVAPPRQDRWHTRPVPLFGGVAIAVTVIALTLVAGDLNALAFPPIGGALILFVAVTD